MSGTPIIPYRRSENYQSFHPLPHKVRRLRPGSVEAKKLAVVKFVEVWQAKKKEAAAESDATAAPPKARL
eukprot:g9099.t1